MAAQLYVDPQGLVDANIDMISVCFNLNGPDPFPMYQLFDPAVESAYNYSGFQDSEATALLQEANGEFDDAERARLTVEAEAIIMKSLPIIPIVSPNAVVYTAEGVTGAPASFAQMWYPWAADLGGEG